MRTEKIKLPTHVFAPFVKKKNKMVGINLNEYRNWHFRVETKIKAIYRAFCYDALKSINKFDRPVKIHYRLFRGSKQSFDTNNFTTIIDKYFQDELKEKHIVDDNFRYVVFTSSEFGGFVKGDHYCEVEITEVEL